MKNFEDKLDTVLVIDDEPFNTEWLTEYFKARGYKVVEASDLQSALDALVSVRRVLKSSESVVIQEW